jgi:GcrA cell cycle regulator
MLPKQRRASIYRVYAWDDASDEKLITYRRMGYTYRRIAELLDNPSVASVEDRAAVLKQLVDDFPPNPVASKPFTETEIERFKSLYFQDIPMLEIARQMGRTKNAICGIRHRLGLPKRSSIAVPGQPNPYTPVQNIKRKLRCDGRPKAPKIAKDPVELRAAEERIKEAADVGFHNGGLTFAQLTPTCCRFIKGEVQDPAHRYCGSKVVEGKSWCRHHYGVVFRNVR